MSTTAAAATNHYVYLLQSKVSDMNYIGVRTCKCKIGDDPYMGSSRHMTQEDKSSCNKIILKRFSTRKEAVAYEVELHGLFDVARNPQFWNKAKQTVTGFDTGGRILTDDAERLRRSNSQKERYAKYGHHGTGKKQTAEHRRNAALSRTGRKLSKATKAKMSASAPKVDHWAYLPWWYEYEDGERIEVRDKTISQAAEEWGVPFHCLKDRFRSRCAGRRKQNEPLKGILVGRLDK